MQLKVVSAASKTTANDGFGYVMTTLLHPLGHPRVMRRRIAAYAEAKGWQVDRVVREETGVLPVVMGGDLDNYWASGSGRTAKAGARGAFFHPVTSYSLPDAVRNAIFIAEQPDLDGDKLNMLMRQRADAHWKSGKFFRMLNRMMFRASMPNERYKVLERFYTLKPGLIERFYSGKTTGGDKARILSGKPPVPVGKAIRALRPTSDHLYFDRKDSSPPET